MLYEKRCIWAVGVIRPYFYGWQVRLDLTNRLRVVVRLFSNRSQMTSKCGEDKTVVHEVIAECVTVLTTFWRHLWTIHGFASRVCILIVTQFKSCDDLFGTLRGVMYKQNNWNESSSNLLLPFRELTTWKIVLVIVAQPFGTAYLVTLEIRVHLIYNL